MGRGQTLASRPLLSLKKGNVRMPTAPIKAEALRLVEQLPDDATWEDLMYEIYVRQAIEAGMQDSPEGLLLSVDEVRELFGLAPSSTPPCASL
jgi:hypothetical protein